MTNDGADAAEDRIQMKLNTDAHRTRSVTARHTTRRRTGASVQHLSRDVPSYGLVRGVAVFRGARSF